jgi:hypothetical protein
MTPPDHHPPERRRAGWARRLTAGGVISAAAMGALLLMASPAAARTPAGSSQTGHLQAVGVVAARPAEAALLPAAVVSPAAALAPRTTSRLAPPTPVPSSSPSGSGEGGGGSVVSPPPITLPALPTGGPTTAPSPASSGGSSGQKHCGYLDVTCHVTNAIDGWFAGLVTAALHPVLSLLGSTVLSTPDLAGAHQVWVLWTISAGIANAAFVLLVLAGGVIVMGYETVQTQYSFKQIAPRLVIGLIAANASLALAGLGIGLANTLSAALLGQPVGSGGGVSAQIGTLVLAQLSGGIFLDLVAGIVAAVGLLLLVLYVLRVALLAVLLIAGPIALAGHALPQTQGLASLWWRAVGGCLGVQVGQSLVLITAVRVLLAPGGSGLLGLGNASGAAGGLLSLLVVLCLLLLLVMIPIWAARAVTGGRRGGGVAKVARDVLVYRYLRPGGGGRHR